MELYTYFTMDCNLRCKYCYVPFSKDQISYEVLSRTIDLLRADDCLNIFGGEPLTVAPKVLFALKRLSDKSCKVKLFTNGTIYNQKVVDALLAHKGHVTIQISYDGKKQDAIGGGDYSKVEENIKRYIKAFDGLCCKQIHIEFTAVPKSLLGLASGISTAIDLGALSIGIIPVVEEVWSKEDVAEYKNQFTKIGLLIEETYFKGNPVSIYPFTLYKNNNQGVFGCGAGKHTICVSPKGELWTCHRYFAKYGSDKDSKFKLGSIFTESSLDRLNESGDYVALSGTKCDGCLSSCTCSKCHFVNFITTGNQKVPPEYGICDIAEVQDEVSTNFLNRMLETRDTAFLKEAGDLFSSALRIQKSEEYSYEKIISFIRLVS